MFEGSEYNSDAAAIVEAVVHLHKADPVQLTHVAGSAMVLSVPNGRAIQSVKKYLDEYLVRPERRKGTAHMTSLASFIGHANRFKGEHSAVFCNDGDSPSLTAVLNYHDAVVGNDSPKPDWGDHRTRYGFPVSEEWEAWAAPRKYEQRAFAEFLEDHIADIVDPASVGEVTKAFAENLGISLAGPQKMMELSRGLSVTVNHNVGAHVNLASGEGSVQFDEAHSQKGQKVNVPGGFAVGIPVFKNGPMYQLPIRLRYRVEEGSIGWSFVPFRTDLIKAHALTEACETVTKETSLPLFYGSPE